MKENLSENLSALLQGFTQSNPDDLAILGVAVFSLIGFVGSMLLYLRSRGEQTQRLVSNSELTLGLRGRLEKLEMNFNASKTENIRAQRFSEAELLFVRKEIIQIKKHLGLIKSEEELNDQLDQLKTYSEQHDEFTKTVDSNALRDIAEGEQEEVEDKEQVVEPLSTKVKKTRKSFLDRLKDVFKDRTELDQASLDDLEEALVTADIGVKTSVALLKECRESLEKGQSLTKGFLLEKTKEQISDILRVDGQEEYPILPQKVDGRPYVVLLIGVNGSGKTTSTAKLAYQWSKAGLNVTLAAADTFRAAAVEQLCNWGKQMDVPVVTGPEKSKPATVVFDAVDQAIENQSDVLLIDTAGRLHNKNNLMQELEGINNVIKKKLDREADEVVLVLDGTTGQNALSQAHEFNSAVPLSGIVVTKLDGTSKGGIVVAIKSELNVPVRYIGVGESKNDLRVFNAEEFTQALFSENSTEAEAAALENRI